jgi:hypothetical protein
LEEKKQNEKTIGSVYLKIFRIKRIIGLGYFIKKKQNHRIVKELEWEMPRIGRGGIDGLKNRSGKCEGPAEGDQRVKEPEWEMRRTGRGGSTG